MAHTAVGLRLGTLDDPGGHAKVPVHIWHVQSIATCLSHSLLDCHCYHFLSCDDPGHSIQSFCFLPDKRPSKPSTGWSGGVRLVAHPLRHAQPQWSKLAVAQQPSIVGKRVI